MMDDSKLRLRARRGIACEEGNAESLGCMNSMIGNNNAIHNRSSENLRTMGIGVAGGTPMNINSNSNSISFSKFQGRFKRRIRQKVLPRACRLFLGGLVAAIVTATLSIGFLPFSWTQVDYHHQLQHEVQSVYQKLHENRQNYHSVIDNYHPNGMSPLHNRHHHIHGTKQQEKKKKRKQNEEQDRHHNRPQDRRYYRNDNDDAEGNGDGNFQGPLKDGNEHVAAAIETAMGPINDRVKPQRNLRRPSTNDAEETPEEQDQQQVEEQQQQVNGVAEIPKPEIVTCGDGTVGFKNDDYCDCLEDGLDEPDTSACSHVLAQRAKFVCGRRHQNDKEQQKTEERGNNKDDTELIWIYTSRVNDGIIDCPDGSDEYGHVGEKHA